ESRKRSAGLFPCVPLGAAPRGHAGSECPVAVCRHLAELLGQGIHAPFRNDPPLAAVIDALRPTTATGGNHGRSTTHRLLHHQAEAVAESREYDNVGCLVLGGKPDTRNIRNMLKQSTIRLDKPWRQPHP